MLQLVWHQTNHFLAGVFQCPYTIQKQKMEFSKKQAWLIVYYDKGKKLAAADTENFHRRCVSCCQKAYNQCDRKIYLLPWSRIRTSVCKSQHDRLRMLQISDYNSRRRFLEYMACAEHRLQIPRKNHVKPFSPLRGCSCQLYSLCPYIIT